MCVRVCVWRGPSIVYVCTCAVMEQEACLGPQEVVVEAAAKHDLVALPGLPSFLCITHTRTHTPQTFPGSDWVTSSAALAHYNCRNFDTAQALFEDLLDRDPWRLQVQDRIGAQEQAATNRQQQQR